MKQTLIIKTLPYHFFCGICLLEFRLIPVELVDRFCAGISDWSLQTKASEKDVFIFIMATTGGSEFVRPELFYDPTALIIEDVKKWLEQLLSMTYMSDRFLIYSLIKVYNSVLEDQFENAYQGKKLLRDANKRIHEKTDNPHIAQNTHDTEIQVTLTLEELPERRMKRDTWRTVYAPVLDYINHFGFVSL